MNIEDHLPPEGPSEEEAFWSEFKSMLDFGMLIEASHMISDAMLDFFTDYRNDPILYGLLNLANHIVIEDRDEEKVYFSTKSRSMNISVPVAQHMFSMHDIACLLLIERSRLIANRSAHAYLPEGMDLSQMSHRYAFEMALSSWSVALSRCFCASILPERLYGKYTDMEHALMHGINPDMLAQLLKPKFPHITEGYLWLYNQSGQEMYHAAMNRVAGQSFETIAFATILEKYWLDLQKNAPSNEQLDDMVKAMLVSNPDDGEDDKPKKNQEYGKEAGRNHGGMQNVAVVDIDIETDIDRYLSDFMRFGTKGAGRSNGWFSFGDPLHGMANTVPDRGKIRARFDNLHHEVMLEAERSEDGNVFGTFMPPEHPSSDDLAHYAQGYPPMLWETHMAPTETTNRDARYAIYMDVSGSMYEWFPIVRALVRTLGVYVDPDHIYGFSDSVTKLDMDAGYLRTTGGTHINSVFDHARDTKISHLILVTDLGDSYVCDTSSIEHVVLVATLSNTKEVEISSTVLRDHEDYTQIDTYSVMLSQVTRKPISGKASFNNNNNNNNNGNVKPTKLVPTEEASAGEDEDDDN